MFGLDAKSGVVKGCFSKHYDCGKRVDLGKNADEERWIMGV